MFYERQDGAGVGRISVLSLETGENKIVVEGGRQPYYTATGHLVYEQARTGNLMAVLFNVGSLELTGEPIPVLEGVRTRRPGMADYALSEDGTLVYVPGYVDADTRQLLWVDREGKTQPITESQLGPTSPRLSPDGHRIAMQVGQGLNLFIYEIARDISSQLTFSTNDNRTPIWSPDGKLLAFSALENGQRGVFLMPVDGSGEVERLTTSATIQIPTSWSTDGVLIYSEGFPDQSDIWVLTLEGERTPRELMTNEFNEGHAMFSPYGRWIAFTSDRSGQDEVYVKHYSDEGPTMKISRQGGNEPVWSRDSKELFYRNAERLMVVPIQMEPTFAAATPRLLFEGRYATSSNDWASNYDVSIDGQSLLMVKAPESINQIHVVLNWFEELKRLVPTDN